VRLLSQLLGKIFSSKEPDGVVSAVLLLREARFISAEKLTKSAISAFGSSENPYVVQGRKITFVIAGRQRLNLSFGKCCYDLEDPPTPELWSQLRAFTAIDHLDRTMTIKDRLVGCARMAAEIIDENCIAVYFPNSGRLFPNDLELKATLLSIF
jgi:hypothetical protein